jgi:small conductance mechanosensitive channel
MDFLNNENYDMDQMIAYATEFGVTIITAILVLIIGLWFAGFVERRLKSVFGRMSRMDETVGGFLASLGKYTILVFTIIALLDQFGVETTSLVAVIGAAGLAIGLALQGTLSNLAAGVMLLIFRPFKTGQFIEVAGFSGTCKSISLFLTKLDTPDNVRITLPNSSVWGSAIRNFNHHEIRRLDQVYGIAYDANTDRAIAIIKEVIGADERAMSEPEPLVAVTALADSSVNIVVRVWCKGSDYWALNWYLLKTVKETFDKEGIGIPFPCRTIYQAAAE